jgi:hypothetical protein
MGHDFTRAAAGVGIQDRRIRAREAGREIELHAQKSGEARLGEAVGRLAMVPPRRGGFIF